MGDKNIQITPLFKPFFPKESMERTVATMNTPWIGGDGPRVKEFEEKISEIIGNKNVSAVNSGTSALHLALRMAGVVGGEVVTTPMTCVATNAPIVNEGADIVWSDIDPDTGNIDPKDIERKITKKTRAIMVVDWGGSACDFDAINKIAKAHKIPVIEDAAQSLGSTYSNKPIGSHCDFVCFSTQAIKIINTADGGLLATKKPADTHRARLLRWYGIDRERRVVGPTFWDYPIKEAGFKMQMTDVNASIGLGQLPYLSQLVSRRQKIAKIYEEAIKKSKSLRCQKILPKASPNYWMFTILCDSKEVRLKLWESLDEIGVQSGEAHIRNDLYPAFRKYRQAKLPGVAKFNNQKLIIPNGYWVDEKTAERVAEVLANF